MVSIIAGGNLSTFLSMMMETISTTFATNESSWNGKINCMLSSKNGAKKSLERLKSFAMYPKTREVTVGDTLG